MRRLIPITALAVFSTAANADFTGRQAPGMGASHRAGFSSSEGAGEDPARHCNFDASGKFASARQFFLVDDCPDLPYQHADRDRPFKAAREGVAVYVDHVSSQRDQSSVVPVVQIFDDHMPVASAVFSDSETVNGSVWVTFARLDPGSRKPQVIVTRNQGGGAKCCFLTAIFSKVGSGWERIEAPYQYADLHYRIMDVDADGYFELVGLDSEQIARSSREGPDLLSVRTYALRGTTLSDMP